MHLSPCQVFVEEFAVHVAMATPGGWEKRESIKSLQLHENQIIRLLVDRVSPGGPQVARC